MGGGEGMAVYGWIYANAKIKGDMGDYRVRRCDSRLSEYGPVLTAISRSMLSTTKRYGEDAEMQQCWFSGFLDRGKGMYALAAAGGQEQFLGISLAGGGFRRQYCVLAYVFTGEDIRVYGRKEEIFRPLAENLMEIQHSGKREWGADTKIVQVFPVYALDAGKGGGMQGEEEKQGGSIRKSSAYTDREVWKCSMQRPVATGLLDGDAAGKILEFFPDALVTVLDGAAESLRADAGKSSGLKERFEREDEEKRRRKQEQEQLRRQTEEGRKLLEAGVSQEGRPAGRGGGLWKALGSVCLLGGILGVISGIASCVA